MAKMVSSLFLLVCLCSCVHVCMLPFFGLGDGGRDPAPLRLASFCFGFVLICLALLCLPAGAGMLSTFHCHFPLLR